MDKPVLYIFSGLPGTGKTTLAKNLSTKLNATYVRIDTIEQALRNLFGITVEGEGYALAYQVAAENLRLGMSVVADSCNPLELTRREWEDVASKEKSKFLNIEVKCTDLAEHRSRVESRVSSLAGHEVPSWEDVMNREYHQWRTHRLEIDTAKRSVEESFNELISQLDSKSMRSE